MPPDTLLPVLAPWLDLAGLAVFAASGALAAARRGQTMVTLIFFALVAAVCLSVAVVIWVTPERWWRDAALDWFDAVGLAAYAVYGAAKSLDYGVPPVPAFVLGVVSACVGGIIRDVLAGEPSILMRPELYVTAAALASALFVGLTLAGMVGPAAAVIAATAGFALRAAAIRWRIHLPAYRGRR